MCRSPFGRLWGTVSRVPGEEPQPPAACLAVHQGRLPWAQQGPGFVRPVCAPRGLHPRRQAEAVCPTRASVPPSLGSLLPVTHPEPRQESEWVAHSQALFISTRDSVLR